MGVSIWNVISTVLLPTGLVLCFLMLCGSRTLERLAQRGCGVQLHLGELKLRAPVVIFVICAITFATEWRHLLHEQTLRPPKTDISQSLWKADLARHQRNWWLSLCTCITWAILLRLSPIISALRNELDTVKAKKSAVVRSQSESPADGKQQAQRDPKAAAKTAA